MTKQQRKLLLELRKLSASRLPECDHIVGYVVVYGEAALINPEWQDGRVRLVCQSRLNKESEWASTVNGAYVAVWLYCPVCRKKLVLPVEK